MDTKQMVSCIIPAKNEALSLKNLLPLVRKYLPADSEIIVVNDGSTDNTSDICAIYAVKEVRQPYSKGNGAAIKSGARVASGDILLFMDADGQHKPEDIPRLLEALDENYDMAVGARTFVSQASLYRGIANSIYNRFASFVVGHKIEDLTSGFRAVKARLFREFLYLLPNGFSYPTTITMAFFRAGYSVHYLPVVAEVRTGASHIRPLRDGLRFLLTIFKIGTLYSPLKIFVPVAIFFFTAGILNYLYTYLSQGRLTNMTVILLVSSVFTFLIGLISEQITSLMYKDTD
jgi:glycosyltransferase involved in cell wall biosynthesis